MGLIDVSSALPNNTKCSNWKDVKHSHTLTRLEKLQLQDVYGTLILLAIGLTGAAMALATELVVARMRGPNKADPEQTKGEKNLDPKSANGTKAARENVREDFDYEVPTVRQGGVDESIEQQDAIMVEAVELIETN